MCLIRAVPGTAHTSQIETILSTSLVDMVVTTGRLSRQQIAFVAEAHGSRDILARSAEELASTAAGRKPDSTWNNALLQLFKEYLNISLIHNILQKTTAQE